MPLQQPPSPCTSVLAVGAVVQGAVVVVVAITLVSPPWSPTQVEEDFFLKKIIVDWTERSLKIVLNFEV
jgi:hypothetical protein